MSICGHTGLTRANIKERLTGNTVREHRLTGQVRHIYILGKKQGIMMVHVEDQL